MQRNATIQTWLMPAAAACLALGCQVQDPSTRASADAAADDGDTDAGLGDENIDDENIDDIDDTGEGGGESTGFEDDPRGLDFDADIEPQAINGSGRIVDTNTNPRWPGVVGIDGVGCTGTLVSPVHVLTAGHCGTGSFIQLDTPRGTGAGPVNNRRYNVIQTQILSPTANSGRDLAIMLLDRAVPEYGTRGAPWYAVEPAFPLASFNTSATAWTVGYGTDCSSPSTTNRRGLSFSGGFRRYTGAPGALTRFNLGCGNAGYRGPNTGDSGGPLFDGIGQIVGVFSGWSCRDNAGTIGAPGCQGTIEWTGFTSSNRAWINGAMDNDFDGDGTPDIDDPRPGLDCRGSSPDAGCQSVLPDLEIVAVADGGCTHSGGDPMVKITVRNNGPVAASGWVDVFVGRPSAPPIGTFSSIFRRSDTLEYGQTQDMWFAISPTSASAWVDALADTTTSVTELNESNNHQDAFITFPDCSL